MERDLERDRDLHRREQSQGLGCGHGPAALPALDGLRVPGPPVHGELQLGPHLPQQGLLDQGGISLTNYRICGLSLTQICD